MKKLQIILFFAVLPICSYAQIDQLTFNHQVIDFSTPPRTGIYPMSLKLLDSYNSGGPTQFGTILEIYGLYAHQTSQLNFGGWDNSKIRYRQAFYGENTWSEWTTLLDSKNDVESAGSLKINGTANHYIANGNLLIGKTTQQNTNYKLDVNGSIRANEIKVNLDGADFVFEKDYKLMPLDELEKFVTVQKHLPEVITAEKMKENGVDLGSLNSKFLQKIEELTLYVIEQNKKIIELEKQNEKIKILEEKIKIIESTSKSK
ncbi:hypothetical protein [Flavobacterium hydatis]|uniref:Peptidase S74 domain-containing protein n=1 Tax=Flavobacterium hydatis TaxID=991 RepID=A0ABX4CKK3_FLAHY|nr:hypothetical protein [Flavobacterium hydatis]OXA96577.1 hypothetical protein B0A62_04760 [Flavobacterium hydatis]